MIKLELTKCQFNSITAFLELIQLRIKEPTNKKNININSYSISKHLGTDYSSVKKALNNLYKKTKDLKL